MKMNSMSMSIIALVIAFILALVILWVSKMKFVLKDPDAAKKEVAWDKILAYSALFAVIIAIVVLLVAEGMGKGKGGGGGGRSMGYRYCGASN